MYHKDKSFPLYDIGNSGVLYQIGGWLYEMAEEEGEMPITSNKYPDKYTI